ncbi:uncharacterized protein LOC117783559 isoform X1 [Drosophila innubila]|uniref:uncharacterized protein LOC117783559 isoform X1 n=1 Tax=Drosophila innubila TaxID=198719 RepID=UPI00148CB847|nr:uncharacterized protein LOC117783559 isoform X1 [Drosophila innubila]
MILKIQSETARKTIAVLSVIVSITFIVFTTTVFVLNGDDFIDQRVFNHICLLQIIASGLLFIGTVYANQWFFLPWMLVAFAFAYTLVYKSLYIWSFLLNDVKYVLIINFMLYTLAGFWFYFIHAVYVDFMDMKTEDKKNYYIIPLKISPWGPKQSAIKIIVV